MNILNLFMKYGCEVTIHAVDASIIDVPKCPECNEIMQAMVSKDAKCWICFQCPAENKPKKQAIAIALDVQRRAKKKKK